jgi:hypothetical protein
MDNKDYYNHYGIIKMTRQVIYNTDYRELQVIFSRFIPIYIENNMVLDLITYYGFCEEFDIVKEGEETPEYKIVIEKQGKIKSLKFERKLNG